MRKVTLLALLCSNLCANGIDFNELRPDATCKTQFVVVIPSYNNELLYEGNLESVLAQESSLPFEVLYINDSSTDRTGELVEAYVKNHQAESIVKIIHNACNQGALFNIYHAIHDYIDDDEKVVVLLDGDDQFYTTKALLRLEYVYKNSDIWLTYGSAIRSNNGKRGLARSIPEEALLSRTIRNIKPFPLHALRTFKAGLFKKIKLEDLLDKNGAFYEVSSDPAYMYPMAEMCAPTEPGGVSHLVYIEDFLYYWNTENPISDGKVRLGYQKARTRAIRAKQPYDPIKEL